MSIVSRGQIRPGEGLRETVSRPLFLFAVLLFPVTVCAAWLRPGYALLFAVVGLLAADRGSFWMIGSRRRWEWAVNIACSLMSAYVLVAALALVRGLIPWLF